MSPPMIRYLASAFVEATNLSTTPQDVGALLSAFGSSDLMPNMLNVLAPSGFSQRLSFQSPDGLRQIIFGPNRFDYVNFSPTPVSTGLGSFAEFCQEAHRLLAASLAHFGKIPQRLAAVREAVGSSYTGNQMDEVGQRLLRLPPFFAEHPRYEWSWRCMSRTERRLEGSAEQFNAIASVRRASIAVSLQVVGLPMPASPAQDSLYFEYDINSSPDNMDERFSPELVTSFFRSAPEWHEELSHSIDAFIEVDS